MKMTNTIRTLRGLTYEYGKHFARVTGFWLASKVHTRGYVVEIWKLKMEFGIGIGRACAYIRIKTHLAPVGLLV